MTQADMEKILEIGLALSSEKNYDRLLEQILADVMTLTRCDFGILYIKEGEALSFKTMRSNTRKDMADEGEPGFAPIPLSQNRACVRALKEKRTINAEHAEKCGERVFLDIGRPDMAADYSMRSILVVPMEDRAGRPVGVLQLINALDEDGEPAAFSADSQRLAESVASQAAVAIENMNYVRAIKGLFHSFVQVLSSAIDERTPYNAAHTKHMVSYGSRFLDYVDGLYHQHRGGRRITPEYRDELLMSIWLHDIGKLVTPLEVMNKSTRLGGRLSEILQRFELISLQSKIDALEGRIGERESEAMREKLEQAGRAVRAADNAEPLGEDAREVILELSRLTYRDKEGLEKPWLTQEETDCLLIGKGTLTEEERKVMENHVCITEKLLAQIRFSSDYQNVPFWSSSHHEYLNGTGYPKRLKGEEIPYEVRLITILDIFDALTASDRPYKKGMPVEQALEVLTSMAWAEGKLDEELTRQFVESRCWEEARETGGAE